jgi:hypothetical protein
LVRADCSRPQILGLEIPLSNGSLRFPLGSHGFPL